MIYVSDKPTQTQTPIVPHDTKALCDTLSMNQVTIWLHLSAWKQRCITSDQALRRRTYSRWMGSYRRDLVHRTGCYCGLRIQVSNTFKLFIMLSFYAKCSKLTPTLLSPSLCCQGDEFLSFFSCFVLLIKKRKKERKTGKRRTFSAQPRKTLIQDTGTDNNKHIMRHTEQKTKTTMLFSFFVF